MPRFFIPFSRCCARAGLLLFVQGVGLAQTYQFTTLAGRASIGASDGIGSDARFSGPEGVAVDASGTLFVADTRNHIIRRITREGAVTTLAGSAGVRGSADGIGAAARFSSPVGLVVDAGGNLFVAEQGNHTIRRIAASGVVTTIAGRAGVVGAVDGAGAIARFNSPTGIAAEPSGALIVADQGNRTIRRITADGIVSTLAGVPGNAGALDGPAASALFGAPYGVAIDREGNVFVSDTYTPPGKLSWPTFMIRQIAPTGTVTTLARAPFADPSMGQFRRPRGVTLDPDGNILFADDSFHVIWRVTRTGSLTRAAGVTDDTGSGGSADGGAAIARFSSPAGLATDAAGTVYVADANNNAIRAVAPNGSVRTIAGLADPRGARDGRGAEAQFRRPRGVAVDTSGNVFVADHENHTIRRIAADGRTTTIAGRAGQVGRADGAGSAARFSSPVGVVVDGAGNVYVADSGNAAIRKIDVSGIVSTLAGPDESVAGQRQGFVDGIGLAARFSSPHGLALDGAGNLLVADLGNGVIRRVTPDRAVTTLRDSRGEPLPFVQPSAVAADRGGRIYVVESGYGSLARVEPDGIVTRIATTTSIPYPLGGVAVDGEGNLFVSGERSHEIRKLTAAGEIVQVAGRAILEPDIRAFGSADGLGSAALFNAPSALAVDANGGVFVADTLNHTIRMGVPAADPARLVNCSILTTLGSANDSVSLGVLVGGSGTSGGKALLARAGGPSLAVFGVNRPLRDPRIEVFGGGSVLLGENDDWSGVPTVGEAFARVGAFPFSGAASKDSALLYPRLGSGSYAVRVSTNEAEGGTVLSEIYDATPTAETTPTTPRLTNVSVLRMCESEVTAGFIIGGVGVKTLLIRAVGPTLGQFGITDYLDDPKLELLDTSAHVVAANDNWSDGGTPEAASLYLNFPRMGAFRLVGASLDSSMIVTLEPGSYTARILRGIGRPTGFVLLEIYELP